jgi:CHAT domain-containing protein
MRFRGAQVVRPLHVVICAIGAAVAQSALAEPSISSSDNFIIGGGNGPACRAQASDLNDSLPDPFDQSFEVYCPDAASTVARLYALRGSGPDGYNRLRRSAPEVTDCSAYLPVKSMPPGTMLATCSTSVVGVPYRSYRVIKNRTLFVAEGLAGYDAVLRLGLRSLLADRANNDDLNIPATAATDAASLATSRSAGLNPARAALEAYSLNNGGDYTEAIEFFQAALQRGGEKDETTREEYQAALALQHSNLGQFREADAVFKKLQSTPAGTASAQLLRDNFYAAHLINARRYQEALTTLSRSTGTSAARSDPLLIDSEMSDKLNGGSPVESLLAGRADFSPQRREAMLRAQSLQLRGTAFRLSGEARQARSALLAAEQSLSAFPPNFELALARLLAQVWTEIAVLDADSGAVASAETNLTRAITLLDKYYPNRPAALAAKARLAALWAKHSEPAKAVGAYRAVVASALDLANRSSSSQLFLKPYFELYFSEAGDARPTVSELFTASQLLGRPGLAQTQATLARELGAGSDDASVLFRSSLTLTREAEKLESELRSMEGDGREQDRQVLGERLRTVRQQQTATLARLSEFPKFRAFSSTPAGLDELQRSLRLGEAYWKLTIANQQVYAFFVTQDAARLYKVPLLEDALVETVDRIRASVSQNDSGVTRIYPFDARASSNLFAALAGPVSFDGIQHLIFEPDGPLFQLPIGLLVIDSKSADLYEQQVDSGQREPFDFRQVRWLATAADISTSVSPRSFLDVRAAAPSSAANAYIGFGENAAPPLQSTVKSRSNQGQACSWPLAAWRHPISARELRTASSALGVPHAPLVTGEAFTDQALLQRRDMHEYRIMHFATHGLAGTPSAGCFSEPSILTSIGPAGSDGLLSFREIFDLKLDADLIVLSACDTATAATAEATRSAGLRKGGDSPLDGLVRSFVAAGARAVLATHWAVPDDFDATETLISTMFKEGKSRSISGALRASQLEVLGRQETSHPFYWAAFALIGDGSRPFQSKPARVADR